MHNGLVCARRRKDILNIINETDRKILSEFQSLPRGYFDFKKENVRKHVHGIHNYPAILVSPIAGKILEIMKKIMPIHTVLDPFCGSGTVPVECMLSGVENVYGLDINPLALAISKAKTQIVPIDKLKDETTRLKERIDCVYKSYETEIEESEHVMKHYFMLDMTERHGWGNNAQKYLKEYTQKLHMDVDIPSFQNLGYWFKPQVILTLSIIKRELTKIDDDVIRNFMVVAFSETVRIVSNTRNSEFKMWRMPSVKVLNFCPDTRKIFYSILNRNIEKMEQFQGMLNKDCKDAYIYYDNAMELNNIPDSSIDLVITSPPYGDSMTTVSYGKFGKLSLQWMELEHMKDGIINIDRILMGGKNHKEELPEIKSDILAETVIQIKKKSPKRAIEVCNFYIDLQKAIEKISSKTKKDGYQFWIVGNRTVSNILIETDKIIAEIAKQHGLSHILTEARKIQNKRMPFLNSPHNEKGSTSKTMTNEYIVVFRKIK